ncbi:SnoaL-like domain-containing protein, partial [Dysosmobacter welbionis]
YQSREGHRHRQPLELCQPLPEQDRPQQDRQDGIHIVGEAGVDHVPVGHRPDVDAPVDADHAARSGQQPPLPPVPERGPHTGQPVPPQQQDASGEHHGPHDAAGQHIQGIHLGQQLPEDGQQAPDDIAGQHIQRALVFHWV